MLLSTVRYAASVELTTADKVRQEITDFPEGDSAILCDLVPQVSDLIRSYTNREFKRERVRESLCGYGMTDLMLSRTPLQQVFSVAYKGEPITDFVIKDPGSGLLFRDRGWDWTAQRAGWLVSSPLPGTEAPSFVVDYIGDYFLPGDDYIAATISADAAASKFIDSAAKLPVLAAGDRVKVFGFATAQNNGTFTVVSATESEIVVDGNLVNEAGGPEIGIQVRNLPGDVERAAIEGVKALYLQRNYHAGQNIRSQTLGELSVTFGEQIQPSGLPVITERMLAPWVRLAA